jgi:PAS domain S-box-containing protein
MMQLDERVLNLTERGFLVRLLIGVVLFNLFTIGLAWWTIKQQYDLHHEQAEVSTYNLALALESQLHGQIRANEMALFAVQDELYRQREHGKINAPALNRYIEQVRARLPGIDAIRITDAQGILQYGSDVKSAARISLADRPHFIHLRDAANVGLVISKPQLSRANNKMVIVLARRLAHEDGSFAGMVFAAIPLAHLTHTFASMDVGENGVVAIRDGELTMVARYPESPLGGLAIGSKNAAPELYQSVQAGQMFGTYRTAKLADNVERTVSFRKLGDYPLYVVVGRASVDYLADARLEAKKISGLVATFVLVSLLLSGMAYRAWMRQRKLNQSLLDSETRLNELFENMSSGVAVYRVSGDGEAFIFSALNRAAERFENLRREDLIGRNVVEVFPGVVELGLLDVFKRVWKTGLAERYPLSFYHDGRISGWRDNFVYRLPSGEIVAIYDDVTERMQAQQDLERLNRDFVTLLESTSDFIYFKDKDSRIRFCSQSMAAITNHRSWRELIGKHDLEIFPAETARIYQAEEEPVFREGLAILNRIDPYYDENGNQGWVSTNKWPVFDADGKTVVGIFGISRDITEYKRTEIALQESEARLKAIIENEPECIKIVDENGRLMQMNPAGLAMIEADSEAQVVGRPVVNVIAPEYRDAFTQMHRRVLAGETMKMEFEVLGIKGGRRWLETHAVPLLDNGKVVHLAVTRDISDRKKAEQALKRSNADLERFAYSVSHDMRQPLRAVSGHLQLLQRSMKDKLDEDERENMSFALEGARRMDSMIVSLLDYSRVGRKTESKQWMSSRISLDEALGFLDALIGETKAEVALHGEWPQVFASRDELTRLFQNLIGNAIKFRDAGQAAQIEIDSTVKGELWRVAVRDHGVGIDPQQIDRLFQFFSRLQSRSRFEGTGMGLALCRRIVEHHNGRIWVESEGEGKGSTFIFELPLHESGEA